MKYKIVVPITISSTADIDCHKYELGDKGVTYWPTEDENIVGFIPFGTFGAIMPILPEPEVTEPGNTIALGSN